MCGYIKFEIIIGVFSKNILNICNFHYLYTPMSNNCPMLMINGWLVFDNPVGIAKMKSW